MGRQAYLTELEDLVLRAVAKLEPDAYGIAVQNTILRAGREVDAPTVYRVLQRLEAGGILAPRDGPPRPVRGGRARRYYSLTEPGWGVLLRQLQRQQRVGAVLKRTTRPPGSGSA